jgi:hypothetical protein
VIPHTVIHLYDYRILSIEGKFKRLQDTRKGVVKPYLFAFIKGQGPDPLGHHVIGLKVEFILNSD